MKNVFLIILGFLFSFQSFAQPHLTADTIWAVQVNDSTYTVFTAQRFLDVTSMSWKTIQSERIAYQLQRLDNLTKQIMEFKEKLLADSASVNADIKDTDLNELFDADLSVFDGDWTFSDLKNAKSEVVSILDGEFLDKKGEKYLIQFRDKEGKSIFLVDKKNKKILLKRENKKSFVGEIFTLQKIETDKKNR